MANTLRSVDTLQLLMTECEKSSEIILQSSVIILNTNFAVYIMCLSKMKSDIIEGESRLTMFKYMQSSQPFSLTKIEIPKWCKEYHRILRNRNSNLQCGLIFNYNNKQQSDDLYCLSNDLKKKDSILLRFSIQDDKVKYVTQIDANIDGIQLLDKLMVFKNKIQVILFHDLKTKMIHACYNAVENKFELESQIPYYTMYAAKCGLYLNICHLPSDLIHIAPSNSDQHCNSLWMVGISFGNLELIQYNNKKWNKHILAPSNNNNNNNKSRKYVSSTSALIDNCWLLLIDATTGYLVRYHISTGQKIICTQFKVPSTSSSTDSYQIRIIRNKEIEQTKIISFVQPIQAKLQANNMTWPIALSKMIESYYSQDDIHIINNGKDRFSKYYLYSWVFPIDSLF